jgi:hypothetical protein
MNELKSKINNEPKESTDETTRVLRNAFEHRATWLYLLLDEAKKNHVDYEKIGRDAIFRCGVATAEGKIMKRADIGNMESFFVPFMPETTARVFEARPVEKDAERLTIEFHYCPLIDAWKKCGCADEEIALLCDIAMEGDRGIARACHYELKIASKISEGDPVCRLEFRQGK